MLLVAISALCRVCNFPHENNIFMIVLLCSDVQHGIYIKLMFCKLDLFICY